MNYQEAKKLRVGDSLRLVDGLPEHCHLTFDAFGYTPRKAWVVDDTGQKYFVLTKHLERDMSKPEKSKPQQPKSTVDHPAHYGGKDNFYEVWKVFEAWFREPPPIHVVAVSYLFNTIKYIARAGRKSPDTVVEDLKKAREYLTRAIDFLEGKL